MTRFRRKIDYFVSGGEKVTISGPERPKVRIFRSEGRNVVNFVEKVTISRVGQAFPGGLRGPQSAFPSFSTGLATPKGRGFQNRPFFGSVWPDFSEKVTISGPGSPKVRFSGLRVEMSSISRPGGEKVTISGSGHRYFVKSRQFGGPKTLPVKRKVACHRAILGRQDRVPDRPPDLEMCHFSTSVW